jgi:hypothetical protein
MTERINAKGSTISPMRIIKGTTLLERFLPYLTGQYLVAHSSSGYTIDEDGCEAAWMMAR